MSEVEFKQEGEAAYVEPEKQKEENASAEFEFIKKPPIEAPPIKEDDTLDVSDSVDKDINKQLGIKEPVEEKKEGEKEDRKESYNVDYENLLLKHLYEIVDNFFKVLAEMLGDKAIENTKAENEVIARILYRYSGKMKRETLDSVQFVIIIFKKIARTKWFKNTLEKRMSKAQ